MGLLVSLILMYSWMIALVDCAWVDDGSAKGLRRVVRRLAVASLIVILLFGCAVVSAFTGAI